jgi:hypothetical protein
VKHDCKDLLIQPSICLLESAISPGPPSLWPRHPSCRRVTTTVHAYIRASNCLAFPTVKVAAWPASAPTTVLPSISLPATLGAVAAKTVGRSSLKTLQWSSRTVYTKPISLDGVCVRTRLACISGITSPKKRPRTSPLNLTLKSIFWDFPG